MEKTLVKKMIRNCLYQYQHTEESNPLTKDDYEQLYKRIVDIYRVGDEAMYEVVEDVVYEYLTNY